MIDKRCKRCSSVIETWFVHSGELLAKQLCFECDYWLNKVAAAQQGDIFRNGRKVVRVRQEGGLWHYIIGPEDTSNEEVKLRGFGGARFKIKFIAGPHKGLVVETTNLWCQDEIPERFHEELPCNAEFLPLREESTRG